MDKKITRLEMALFEGWSFSNFKVSISNTSRHSLWVKSPNANGWICHKVDANIEHREILDALLDVAGVPRW